MMEIERDVKPKQNWVVVERPGYLGSRRDVKFTEWDTKYGKENWRLSWELTDGRKVTIADMFHFYLLGYTKYFKEHPDEAEYITNNFSYTFDETQIAKRDAFNYFFLVEKEGFSNQFHHVAINKTLVEVMGINFQGIFPLQVRLGKKGTSEESWPAGWKWHPGHIPCTKPYLIPKGIIHENKWWEDGSIEDLYQSAKVLEVNCYKIPAS